MLMADPQMSLPPDSTHASRSLTAQQVIGILQAIQEISAEGTLEAQLARIAKTTTDLAGCERCSVFLLDAEKGELWSKVAMGLTDQEVRVRVGRGIAGTVAETGTLENIPDAYADPRFNQEVDRSTGFKTRNMLVVPVKDRQRDTIGVLQLINKKEGVFSGTDETVLTVFAAQVATAIQNVQRLEEFRATDLQLKQAFLSAEQKAQERSETRGRLRILKLGVAICLLIVAAFLGLRAAEIPIPFLSAEAPAPTGEGGQAVEKGPAIGQTHTVGRETLSSKIVQTGNAEPANTRAVVPPTSGSVAEVLVHEGQRVTKGQPLVRLDDRELRNRLHMAMANLLRAQTQLQTLLDWARSPEYAQARRSVQLAGMATEEGRGRLDVTRRLFDRGIASRDEMESAERTYERLRLELQSAEENVKTIQARASETEQTILQAQIKNAQAEVDEINRLIAAMTVPAPFDGLVMLPEAGEGRRGRLPEVGDQAQAGSPLLLLGDVSLLRVRLQLDEVDVDKVKIGQRAQARMDAFPGFLLGGRVEFVSPMAKIVEKVAYFDTIVALTALPAEIRARVRLGMSAAIEIVTADRQNVLAVPVQAVIREAGETFVSLADNTQGTPTAVWIPVKLGVSTTKMVEVLEGVQEGDQIVLP
jgi:multidrug resistance efflux pump/GAF domain-containing protein